MSLTLNMVGGGSGGLDINNALIHVTAPVDSTVEFSFGGVVVKTIPPAKAFSNADGKTADYYYSVTSVNYGTWTVTATLGTSTKSVAVAVSAAKQFDVVITYITYIVKSGVAIEQLTPTDASLTPHGGYLTWGGSAVVALLKAKVDLTNFTKIVVVVRGGASWHGGQVPAVGSSATNPSINYNSGEVTPRNGYTFLNNVQATIYAGTYQVDITNLSGVQYVWLSMSYYGGSNSYIEIVDWYLI